MSRHYIPIYLNQEGLIAVANHLTKGRTKDHLTPYILELLKLVLQRMNFTFNDDHYLQVGLTAMGTVMAPNYANLFIDGFETKALEGWDKKPQIWLRFIGSIFIV